MAELTIVDDKGEPVFIDKPSYRFYPNTQALLEALEDDGIDPATVVAHPCTVGTAHTPDLLEYVRETWLEQYDDPDAVDADVSRETEALVKAAWKALADEAPSLWEPRLRERVLLGAEVKA